MGASIKMHVTVSGQLFTIERKVLFISGYINKCVPYEFVDPVLCFVLGRAYFN